MRATLAHVQIPTHAEPGGSVRAAREAAGLSQQTLATRAGIALRTLVRVEQGEDTKVGTLIAIANALGTTAADLLTPSPEGAEA